MHSIAEHEKREAQVLNARPILTHRSSWSSAMDNMEFNKTENNSECCKNSFAERSQPNQQQQQPHGFGIDKDTLQLRLVQRRQWHLRQSWPLASPLSTYVQPNEALLEEFTRSWSSLQLKPPPSPAGPRALTEKCLLKHYEPRVPSAETTFQSDIRLPSFLEPRVAPENALAFIVYPQLKLTLGQIEPLTCKLMVYDVSLGCRVTEEFKFVLNEGSSSQHPFRALFYVLPTFQLANLYLVLKISKVLSGNEDEYAAGAYCNPEKFTANENEKQKLIDKTKDWLKRLGRYQQPLGWGAVPLAESPRRMMVLYRQRTSLSDEQRLLLIPEVVKGNLKEKILAGSCELKIEPLDEERLSSAKFQIKAISSSGSTKTVTNRQSNQMDGPLLEIHDPFSCGGNITTGSAEVVRRRSASNGAGGNNSVNTSTGLDLLTSNAVKCRELFPFAQASAAPTYGLHGSGPVATSYVHVLYLYPMGVEKFQHRNLAVRVQVFEKELLDISELVMPSKETTENYSAETDKAVKAEVLGILKAVYAENTQASSSYQQQMAYDAFSQVNYHQKNPQWEDEVKICLPKQLTSSHHLLFSFYHVHCKKLNQKRLQFQFQSSSNSASAGSSQNQTGQQPQEELVGVAVLPLLDKGGTLMRDSTYFLNVIPWTKTSSGTSASGASSSALLSPGYVNAARDTVGCFPMEKMLFSCRTRVFSSVHSQDEYIADLMQTHLSAIDHRKLPVQQQPLNFSASPAFPSIFPSASPPSSPHQQLVAMSKCLKQLQFANESDVRFFSLLIGRVLFSRLRFSKEKQIRQQSFAAILSMFEKINQWNTSSRLHSRISMPVQQQQQPPNSQQQPQPSSANVQHQPLLDYYVHLFYDESALDEWATEPTNCSAPNTLNVTANNPPKEHQQQSNQSFSNITSVFEAISCEWIEVLKEKIEKTKQADDLKRITLNQSHVLLQLITKSIAMVLLKTGGCAKQSSGTGGIPRFNTTTGAPGSNKVTIVNSATFATTSTKWNELQPATCAGPNVHQLPLWLDTRDEQLICELMNALILQIFDHSNGLLVQKEVNKSVAMFIRGMVLVCGNETLFYKVLNCYFDQIHENQQEPDVLVHLLFPFLKLLFEFEFFGTMVTLSTVPNEHQWLAQRIFTSLWSVFSESRQFELKLRQESIGLLRRMFVVHAYNGHYQSKSQQEMLALVFLRLFSGDLMTIYSLLNEFAEKEDILLIENNSINFCERTTSSAVASAGGGGGGTGATVSNVFAELRKELLICLVHLLNAVSEKHLRALFKTSWLSLVASSAPSSSSSSDSESASGNANQRHLGQPQKHRIVLTGELQNVQSVMQQRKLHLMNSSQQQQLPISLEGGRKDSTSHPLRQSMNTMTEETRMNVWLVVLGQFIDVFLGEPSITLAAQNLLSPELTCKEHRLSLLDLELRIKTRQTRGRGGSDAPAFGQQSLRAVESGEDESGVGSSSTSLLTGAGGAGGTGGAGGAGGVNTSHARLVHRSLPRNWGKNHLVSQRRANLEKANSINDSEDLNSLASPSTVNGSSYGACAMEFARNIAWMHRIVAKATLRTLQILVDENKVLLQLISPAGGNWLKKDSPAVDKLSNETQLQQLAYDRMESITELIFQLLSRASVLEGCVNVASTSSSVVSTTPRELTLRSWTQSPTAAIEVPLLKVSDEKSKTSSLIERVVLMKILKYVSVFLNCFQREVFEIQLNPRRLPHDQAELSIEILVDVCATAESSLVRLCAGKLLYQLFQLCFAQKGSFAFIHKPFLRVFNRRLFEQVDKEPLKIVVQTLDACLGGPIHGRGSFNGGSSPGGQDDGNFQLLFQEVVDHLFTQIRVFEKWKLALALVDEIGASTCSTSSTTASETIDQEEIEDEIFQLMDSLCGLDFPNEKKRWMNTLIKYHVKRQKFEEACCCILWGLEQQINHDDNEGITIKELQRARDFAEKALWYEKVMEINEWLLRVCRQTKRMQQYEETVHYMEEQWKRLEANGYGSAESVPWKYYKICFQTAEEAKQNDDATTTEYIYKRSRYTSLSDMMAEMTAMLKKKYAETCKQVEILPESKPFPEPSDVNQGVVYLRIMSVEECTSNADRMIVQQQRILQQALDCSAVYMFSTPFTWNGSAYGKTKDQLKKKTLLHVDHRFPYLVSRQPIRVRYEEIRSPIENSMDDIHKRCEMLQQEIRKEVSGKTDLKTLTLVLKGSVDTHVHGGAAEVMESFLGMDTELVDRTGKNMPLRARQEAIWRLENLLVEFLVLCAKCLVISRDAFRKSFTNSTPASNGATGSASGSSSSSSNTMIVASGADDEALTSPLQAEFQKGFMVLVELLHSKLSGSTHGSTLRVLKAQFAPKR